MITPRVPPHKQELQTALDQQMVEMKELIALHISGEDKLFDRYLDMVNCLSEDTIIRPPGSEMKVLLGMRRAPAARGNHHDFEGGLMYHLLEMWSVWEHCREVVLREGYVDDNRVLQGIICHDLHKAYRYYRLVRPEPWDVEIFGDESDHLVIENVKSIQILAKHGIILDDEQMNCLLWSEGGFSKTKPNWCSVLAKLVYLLDEFSGNVLGRLAKDTLLDHRKPIAR